MTKTFACLALGLLMSAPVVAATRPTLENSAGSTRLSVGPALGIFSSTTGFGGSLSLQVQTANLPLFLGIDSGFYHWGDSAGTTGWSMSGSVNSIPILPSVLYRFELPGSSVKPYLGAAVGISVSMLSASYDFSDMGFGADSGSETSVWFEGLVKPGLEISQFFIEPKFGILKDEFVFLPTIGMNFSL